MTHSFSSAYSSAFDVDQGNHGNWNKLLDIGKQAAQEYNDWLRDRPVACPYDGTPLQTGPRGELHCIFDGFIWDGFQNV
jgi:hypothetical protein